MYVQPGALGIVDDLALLKNSLPDGPTVFLGDWNPGTYGYDDVLLQHDWVEISDRSVTTYHSGYKKTTPAFTRFLNHVSNFKKVKINTKKFRHYLKNIRYSPFSPTAYSFGFKY